MTKYVIKEGSALYLRKRVRKDDTWSNWNETKIGKVKDINPIFKHAITAIAYSMDSNSFVSPLFTTTWDKREILQALDFWINDKVLENERLLFLEDKLNDTEEIELKNLVKLRKKVNALPNDTVFSRSMYDTGKNTYYRLETWVVQFYQQKKLPARSNNVTATINFDNNFRDDGRRWVIHDLNTSLGELAGYFASTSTSNDEVSGVMGGGRHTERSFQRDIRLRRALSQIGAGTDAFTVTGNPNTWTIARVNGTSGNRWFRVLDGRGRIIQSGLDTAQDAQRYISEQQARYDAQQHATTTTHQERMNAISQAWRTGLMTTDEAQRAIRDVHNTTTTGRWIRQNEFNPSDWRIVRDPSIPGQYKIIDGITGHNLAVGFRTQEQAAAFATNHMRRTTPRSRSRTEPEHPSIPDPYVAIAQYAGMYTTAVNTDDFGIEANRHVYSSITVTYDSIECRINLQLYITGEEYRQLRTHSGPCNITIYTQSGRVTRARINDINYHCLDHTVITRY